MKTENKRRAKPQCAVTSDSRSRILEQRMMTLNAVPKTGKRHSLPNNLQDGRLRAATALTVRVLG